MIRCKYFRKRTVYDYNHGNIVYSAMHEFNNWDQTDVESIISIDTCSNEQGDVETIVVYYNELTKTDAGQ